jgi:glycosyltransferase involved in cell wall biosynthesis
VFTKVVGQSNRDSGIYTVRLTAKYKIRRKLARFLRTTPDDVFHWGRAIAATVNTVHKTDPIDVFEMEESFGWCGDVQSLIPVPVVVKLHGPAFLTLTDEDRQSDIANARIQREGAGLRRVRSIVSPSRRTFLDTVSRYDLDPAVNSIIPNPVMVDHDLKPWNLDECDQKTILFVGRFDKLKGGDTALIAFRRLLELDHRLKLIFVGPDVGLTSADGSRIHFNEFQNSLFSEAQRQNIDYLGKLPRIDISALRNRAMLTIVVSRWENQPNTVLEAMVQGCPVIAFDTGGISEIIEDNVSGLLAQRDDVDDFCRKVLSLVNNPSKARQLGANARRSVTERHSVQRLATEVVALYRRSI